MEQSLREFVIAAQSAYIAGSGFSAVQTVEAGDTRMTASVSVDHPFVSVEYQSYADPFSKLQELLLGNVEYSADDIPNLRAVYDGKTTWIHDRSRDIAVRHAGWHVPSPFPSLRTLGELRFLTQLTSDFLFAEGTPESLHGRQGREVHLKPRFPSESQLLRELRFPFRKASILFDAETYFPLRIVAHPAEGSSWTMLLPPDSPVVLTYRDVHRNPPEARLRYVPSEDTRQFIARTVSIADVAELWPVPLPLDALRELGYHVPGERAHVVWDSAAGQGQVTLEFQAAPDVSPQSDAPDEPARLILRASNFLLHNLGRRKANISEHGIVHEIRSHRVRILDRSSLATNGNDVPGLPEIREAFWETDGLFWFLLGERLDESSLLEILSPLIE
ncbi:hypothetical protein JW848_07225 [Candidatus Bipolaricaulota bacterium]|nr:hypothetical protein [Candidatus Bipolaricaulota bacterium]